MRDTSRLRLERGLAAARLAARGGARYAVSAPRLFAAAGERRQRLRNDIALRNAEDVADTLGMMKGVLMKLGQIASYVDEGLDPRVRQTLSRLQDSVPPMSPELAAGVVTGDFGRPPEDLFATWDPLPIAAASIGQVHRAITRDGQAVAVKVQYPGIRETMEADLRNIGLVKRLLRARAPSMNTDAFLGELRDRFTEELDYEREAANQRMFAEYFGGHPAIHVPGVRDDLSSPRVMTSELGYGARFAEAVSWPREERDQAGETIYRFTFRSLYELRAFNGDLHPGNYLFAPGGRVTFLDFGLVRRFTEAEIRPLLDLERCYCVDADPAGFRRAMEAAGYLVAGSPLSDPEVMKHMALFYEHIQSPGPVTMTPEHATAVARRYLDFGNPLMSHADIPPNYVLAQRINLGLFALLGELGATADWRSVSEEIWPFARAAPVPPAGQAAPAGPAAPSG